jgi:arabinogalactan endo-1,4-beta-galactosidase
MKKLMLLAALFAAFSCGNKTAPTDPASGDGGDSKPEPVETSIATPAFAKGADISWVSEMEASGKTFRKKDGTKADILAVLADCGVNAIRLRVWVNPEGGWNGQADVVAKAKRAQALGLKLLIDFHYSDTWADPGKQNVPAAWQGKDAAAMTAAVKAHTQEVLQALKSAGVDVAWVQVGNEVTNGMLWDGGKVAGSSAGAFVEYFHAGREAVKAVYPQAQVILHLDNGWKAETLNWFLSLMQGRSLRYDILGLSLYPSYWENNAYPDWQPKVRQFLANLPALHDSYGKPVMLVEFGMPASQPDKTKAALQQLFADTAQYDWFEGIFYWEPEAEKARNGYDYGAFSNGKPTAALEAFAD